MTRTSMACYTLMSTAFVVTALIFLQASSLIENRAHAEMAVDKGAITMITTQFQGDTEILYVLDSRAGRLFAYTHNPNRQTIDLLDAMDVGREFGPAGDRAEDQRGGDQRGGAVRGKRTGTSR